MISISKICRAARRAFQHLPIIRKVRGASMAEYAMVTGFIAVVTIGGVVATGTGVATVFCEASSKIGKLVMNDGVVPCSYGEVEVPGPEIVIPEKYEPVSENVILFYEGTKASFILTATSGTIDWGDGTQQTILSGTRTYAHTYADEGRYKVIADGTMSAFANKDAATLREVRSFGTVGFTSLAGAFAQVEALEAVAALPDTVTDISGIFKAAVTVPKQIETWNVSHVTNMASAFEGVGSIGANLAYWDVSNVTTMNSMFRDVADLDLDFSMWDVSSVTGFAYMFSGAVNFDADISMWDTGSATTLKGMFQDAAYFNQPIGKWDVSAVISFQSLFSGASSFNQPLNAWDVSGALKRGNPSSSFEEMFMDAVAFNQPLDKWNVSGVVYDYTASGSSIRRITHNFRRMFKNAASFSQSLASWCVDEHGPGPVEFSVGSQMRNEPLWGYCGTPDFSDGIVLAYRGGEEVTINVPSGDAVISWGNGDFLSTGTSRTGTHVLPAGERVLVKIAGGAKHIQAQGDALLEVVSFGTEPLTSLQGAFQGTHSLEKIAPLPATVTSISGIFLGSASDLAGVETWDTSNVQYMSAAFKDTANFNGPISNWNVGNVRNFSQMFAGTAVFDQPLNDWDVSSADVKGTNAGSQSFMEMFMDAKAFNQPLDRWDMTGMLYNYQLSGSSTWFLSHNFTRMFKGASSFAQSLADWCVSSHKVAAIEFSDGSSMLSEPLWGQCGRPDFSDGIILAYRGGEEVTVAIPSGDAAIDWGDGSYVSTANTRSVTRVLPEGERVEVRIAGGATHIQAQGDALLEVVSFGNEPLTNLSSAFANSHSLERVAPLPASVTNLSGAFRGSQSELAGVEGWDTGNVQYMSGTFADTANFNGPISGWDVSEVKSFNGMFSGASKFNQPLNGWDVSGAAKTGSTAGSQSFMEMFMNAAAFNQPLDTWDVTGVVYEYRLSGSSKWYTSHNFTRMFSGASSFAQTLASWCVSAHAEPAVEFSAGSPMISEPIWGQCGVSSFENGIVLAYRGGEEVTIEIPSGNAGIDWGDGSYHSTATSRTATHRLAEGERVEVRIAGGATSIRAQGDALLEVVSFGDEPLNSLASAFVDTDSLDRLAVMPASVTNLAGTFANSGGKLEGIEAWPTGNVTTLKNTFENATNFDSPIGAWDVSSVASFYGTFSGAASFNQPLNAWDVSGGRKTSTWGNPAQTFRGMFQNASSFNQPLDQWNVDGFVYANSDRGNQVVSHNFTSMFEGATSFTQSLADWCVSKHATAAQDFATGTAMLNEPLWGSCGVPSFDDGIELTYRGGETVSISTTITGVIDWGDGTYNNLSGTHTLPEGERVLVRIAGGATHFSAPGDALLEVVSFGSEPLTSLASAFTGTDSLEALPPLPSTVTNLANAFAGSAGVLAGVEDWDTSSVTTLKGVFKDAVNFDRAVGTWNVAGVTSFEEAFSGAASFNQPLNTWDVSGAKYTATGVNNGPASFREMFKDAVSFNQPLDSWDMSKLRQGYSYNARQYLTNNLTRMFEGATGFAQSLEAWCVSNHPGQPIDFSTGSAMLGEPIWGTCPGA